MKARAIMIGQVVYGRWWHWSLLFRPSDPCQSAPRAGSRSHAAWLYWGWLSIEYPAQDQHHWWTEQEPNTLTQHIISADLMTIVYLSILDLVKVWKMISKNCTAPRYINQVGVAFRAFHSCLQLQSLFKSEQSQYLSGKSAFWMSESGDTRSKMR